MQYTFFLIIFSHKTKTFTGNLPFFLLFSHKRQKLLQAIYLFFLTKDKNFYRQFTFFIMLVYWPQRKMPDLFKHHLNYKAGSPPP